MSLLIRVEEIHSIIKEYGLCAKLLKEAGVDDIEVHAVHEGYLLDQFAIKSMNLVQMNILLQ